MADFLPFGGGLTNPWRAAGAEGSRGNWTMVAIDPLIAGGVVLSTAVTDAVYVFFNAAVTARRRVSAASWSAAWYLLSAFAVIS
jgi:hypothetical protein